MKYTSCPKCGGTSRLFAKTTYVDVPYFFAFDGSEQDNAEMFDNARYLKGGKLCYCQDCGKVVCRTSTIFDD